MKYNGKNFKKNFKTTIEHRKNKLFKVYENYYKDRLKRIKALETILFETIDNYREALNQTPRDYNIIVSLDKEIDELQEKYSNIKI